MPGLTLEQKRSILGTAGRRGLATEADVTYAWNNLMRDVGQPFTQNTERLSGLLENIRNAESLSGSPQATDLRKSAAGFLRDIQEGLDDPLNKQLAEAGYIKPPAQFANKTLDQLLGGTGTGQTNEQIAGDIASQFNLPSNQNMNQQTIQNAPVSRLLGPTELSGLQAQWKKEGLTSQEIESNFLARNGTQISLKGNTPSSQQIIANRAISSVPVGDINASMLGIGATDLNLPAQTAGDTVGGYVAGVGADLVNRKSQLDDTYNKQLKIYQDQATQLQSKIDALTSKQESALDNVQDLTSPYRQQLEEAERKRLGLEDLYFANLKTVNEAQSLMEMLNSDVQKMQGKTGLANILSPRIDKVVADATGRLAILQSTLAMRSDQMQLGFHMIDRSSEAINADRQGQLNYYNSLLNFFSGEKSNLSSILETNLSGQKKIIEAKVGVLQQEIADSQNVVDTVKKIMLEDPNRAEGAGITLNDNFETIVQKLADYDSQQVSKDEQETVRSLALKYPDSGILLTDDYQSAASKVQNSRIYRQETRLSGSTPSGNIPSNNQNGQPTPIEQMSLQAQAVLNGTLRLEDLTPTVKGKIAGELMEAGYKSLPKLSTAQQDDIATMDTAKDLANQILSYNNDGKLEGIGFGTGSLKSVLAQVGVGSEEGKTVRALIGNIKGTIAKLRGGTSFTTNEERLLNTYTPSINNSPSVAINKINLLIDFISKKKQNLLVVAQDRVLPENQNNIEGLRDKYKY